QTYTTIAAAAAVAGDGDIIEIAAGTYPGDVVTWTQQNLTVRAVGGEVVVPSAGRLAANVGIWNVNGATMHIAGITFRDAHHADRNGAGIRLTAGQLTVNNCRFLHNDDGILTASNPSISLVISNSEFGFNGYGDGYSHNLYVGEIDQLTVSGSYFHDALIGHLLKSRARRNLITANLLADGTDPTTARASYELSFPSGGQAVVVGNIIQQSANTENSNMIDIGSETTTKWPTNQLFLVNNTLINNKTGPNTLLIGQLGGATVFANNLIQNNLNQPTGLAFSGGNQVFTPDQINADYSPTVNALAAWPLTLATELDQYLPSDLLNLGVSLTLSDIFIPPMASIPLSNPPTWPGAIQPTNPTPSGEPSGTASPSQPNTTPSPTTSTQPSATPSATPSGEPSVTTSTQPSATSSSSQPSATTSATASNTPSQPNATTSATASNTPNQPNASTSATPSGTPSQPSTTPSATPSGNFGRPSNSASVGTSCCEPEPNCCSASAKPKVKPKVTIKLVKARIFLGSRGKVKITVRAVGQVRPTGKIIVKAGKKKVTVKMKASAKGKLTVRLPKLNTGKYLVKATYQGSSKIAKAASSAVRLRVLAR
ncbi:MAG: Ig-like domain repeat protein, partial [Bifidobacteriaceae bacterium]|nr:Ig-like domain repeat protein [Bifidobacteriaceae bacterium]